MLRITKYLNNILLKSQKTSNYNNNNKKFGLLKSYYSSSRNSVLSNNKEEIEEKEEKQLQEGEVEEDNIYFEEDEINEFENQILENENQLLLNCKLIKERLENQKIDFDMEFKPATAFSYTMKRPIAGDKNNYNVYYKGIDAILFKPYTKFYDQINGAYRSQRFSKPTYKKGQKFHFLPRCTLRTLFDWENKESHLFLFNFIARRLDFKSLDNWYTVDIEPVIKEYGLARLFFSYSSGLMGILCELYPNHNWDIRKFKNLNIHKGFYNAFLLQTLLKEYGYQGSVQPIRLLRPHITQRIPYPIVSYFRSQFNGYEYTKLNDIGFAGKIKIDYWDKLIPTEQILLLRHLELYLIDDPNASKLEIQLEEQQKIQKLLLELKPNYKTKAYQLEEQEEHEEEQEEEQEDDEEEEQEKPRNSRERSYINQLLPPKFKLIDKTKIYDMDFNNNKPFLIGDSITKTIEFIVEKYPTVNPWLFRYQDQSSEFKFSMQLIDYIEDHFKLSSPEDWYGLKYSNELKEILPSTWNHHINFSEFLKAKYPKSTFDRSSFVDKDLTNHFFETRYLHNIRLVVHQLAEKNNIVINKLADFLQFETNIELIKEIRIVTGWKIRCIKDLLHFIYPIESGLIFPEKNKNIKQNITSFTQLQSLVKDLVSTNNLSMEDLYGLQFSHYITTHITIKLHSFDFIPKIYPEYKWIIFLFKSYRRQDEQSHYQFAEQYFNYLLENKYIDHPLDFISFYRGSIHRTTNLKLYAVYDQLLKNNYNITFDPIIDSNNLGRFYRNYLNLTQDEDIGMKISPLTIFSDLKSHVDMLKNNK